MACFQVKLHVAVSERFGKCYAFGLLLNSVFTTSRFTSPFYFKYKEKKKRCVLNVTYLQELPL